MEVNRNIRNFCHKKQKGVGAVWERLRHISCLHQGSKDAADALQKPKKDVVFAILEGDLSATLHRFQVIALDISD